MLLTVENHGKVTQNTQSKLLLPLEKYAGHFKDPWYGNISISLENNRLLMDFEHSPLEGRCLCHLSVG